MEKFIDANRKGIRVYRGKCRRGHILDCDTARFSQGSKNVFWWFQNTSRSFDCHIEGFGVACLAVRGNSQLRYSARLRLESIPASFNTKSEELTSFYWLRHFDHNLAIKQVSPVERGNCRLCLARILQEHVIDGVVLCQMVEAHNYLLSISISFIPLGY